MNRREMLKLMAGTALTGAVGAAGVARAARAADPGATAIPAGPAAPPVPRLPAGSPGALPGVPAPAAMLRTSWSTDPYALGSYSYLPVGATPALRRTLAEPIDGRLFFAGEATSSADPATVHGALESGRLAARHVLKVAGPGETIAVVGAGVAGLACARDLAEAGFAPVVLEARDRIGGRVDTVQPPGWPIPIERGANWVQAIEASDLAQRLDAIGVETAPFGWDRVTMVSADGAIVPDPYRYLAPAARAVQDQNAKKVQGAIDNALARALMGKTDKAKTEGVKFPQEVFDLAVALSQQPQLLPPVLAFYQRMRDRINAAVAEALAEFGGADVDQGKKSNPADAGTTQQ